MHTFNLGYIDGVKSTYWNIDDTLGPGAHGMDVRFVQYLLVHWSYTFQFTYELSEVDGFWGPRTTDAVRRMETNTRWHLVRDGFITPLPEPFHNTSSGRWFKFDALLENYTRRATGHGVNELSADRLSAVMRGIPKDGQCPDPLNLALSRAIVIGG